MFGNIIPRHSRYSIALSFDNITLVNFAVPSCLLTLCLPLKCRNHASFTIAFSLIILIRRGHSIAHLLPFIRFYQPSGAETISCDCKDSLRLPERHKRVGSNRDEVSSSTNFPQPFSPKLLSVEKFPCSHY